MAGIFWFDGRSVAQSDHDVATSDVRAPVWVTAPGLLMAWEGPGDKAGYRGADGSFCVFDGRLHNGRDLGRMPGEPDAAIAMRCYNSGSFDRLGRLIGDWSMTIWDSREHRIVLASDYAGVRPLYYFRSSECVAWSSSLGRLARWMNCRQMDDDYATEFLATGFPRGVTPFRGILPAPPGGAVCLSAERTDIHKTWQLPVDGRIQYRDSREYEEQFRHVFREAVGVRLQDGGCVASELSGGLDSSSVVCMADRLIASGAVAAKGLVSFSYDTAGSCDRGYIETVEKACPTVLPIHLDMAGYPTLSAHSTVSALPTLAEGRHSEVGRRMRNMGADVLLTGQLGDLVTGNRNDETEQAADLFSRGAIGAGIREAFAWSSRLRHPIYPILWRELLTGLGVRSAPETPTTAALSGSLRQRWSMLPGRNRRWVDRALPSRRKRLLALDDMLAARSFQSPEALEAAHYSHPFTHRPLVEFMLSVPSAIICRPGEPRRLMRLALRGIVPDTVLRRGSKGNYATLYADALRDCAADLLHGDRDLHLVRRGFVERETAARMLRAFSRGEGIDETQLRQLVRLELWLRKQIATGAIEDGEGSSAQLRELELQPC
jgi:asparagine synthase (glutamine-hydrolysing)